jgi:mycothiol synthase
VADFTIRPATEADAEAAWAILLAADLGPWYELRAEQFREWWWPSYAGIWAAETNGVVGYSAARGEMVEVYVLPEARGRGIGSRLLAEAEAAVSGSLIETTTRRDERAAPPFLAGHGYERVAETWVMEIELAAGIPEPSWPEGTELRTFAPDDAKAVKELLDLAYANEPDFAERPFEEWKSFMLGDPSFDAESWFVIGAYDGSLVAAAHSWSEGYVKDIVVHPEFRGRGLGKALLLHTFAHFRSRGRPRVALKTDSRNTSQASRFYEHMGMRKTRTYDDWVKRRAD